jgi:bifunctional ADP-heptose synthase (sugar kinase/adenylyltransferase)
MSWPVSSLLIMSRYLMNQPPLELIEYLKPDVLIKGGDWAEREYCRAGCRQILGWPGYCHS